MRGWSVGGCTRLDRDDSFRSCKPTILERAGDAEIRQYAGDNGDVLVSKDEDFKDLSAVHGAPPQVILLRLGNCDKAIVLGSLQKLRAAIEAWLADPAVHCLEIGPV